MSQENRLISRRQALWRSGMGMGALGLAGVLRGMGAVQAAAGRWEVRQVLDCASPLALWLRA